MKKKVGIHIEEDAIGRDRRRAADEGRPLGDIIQDALVSYLDDKIPNPEIREGAYQFFCEQPVRISKNQFKEILGEDV